MSSHSGNRQHDHNKNDPQHAPEHPPPKNPEENDQNMILDDPIEEASEDSEDGDKKRPDGGHADREEDGASDPNPLEFPPPGKLLGRIVGGNIGSLRVKLFPTNTDEPPFFMTYTKPIHQHARFRRHCPVIATLDEYTDEITDLKEDLQQHHWKHYPPTPGIITSVADNGAIKLRAEIEDTKARGRYGVGGYELGELTTFKNRLQTQHVPPPQTRVLFYGVVTNRTRKQQGTNRMPRAERYIDIIHIEVNPTPLHKQEEHVLFPPLRDHLITNLNIDIEIGTSAINTSPNSFGAYQFAQTGKEKLLEIITHAKHAANRALALDEHKDTARKLAHAFNKSPPKLNLLIKSRKHLNHTIKSINTQLNTDPKLRNIIDNIYLITPAHPQTQHQNPLIHNPQILTDIESSPNNFAKHIHHINQPTFEGSYDPTTKTTTHKRAKNYKTYNLIQFTPLHTNIFTTEHTILPKNTLMDTPSFTPQTDTDASDIDEQHETDFIHVAHPVTEPARVAQANQLITELNTNHPNMHIELHSSRLSDWRELKLELDVTQDAKDVLGQLTSSDALVVLEDGAPASVRDPYPLRRTTYV